MQASTSKNGATFMYCVLLHLFFPCRLRLYRLPWSGTQRDIALPRRFKASSAIWTAAHISLVLTILQGYGRLNKSTAFA